MVQVAQDLEEEEVAQEELVVTEVAVAVLEDLVVYYFYIHIFHNYDL